MRLKWLSFTFGPWTGVALAILALVSFPESAHADAGTPLIWAGMLHLTIGNALIGVVEGLLIAWLFKLPKKRCLLLLIPANYFSTWVGGFFGQSWLVVQLPITLNNGWTWFWILVGITYCMTLVLSGPSSLGASEGMKSGSQRASKQRSSHRQHRTSSYSDGTGSPVEQPYTHRCTSSPWPTSHSHQKFVSTSSLLSTGTSTKRPHQRNSHRKDGNFIRFIREIGCLFVRIQMETAGI